jgi:DNA-binding response OmpR family regulator
MHGEPPVLLVDPAGNQIERSLRRCGFLVTRSTSAETALFEIGQRAFDALVVSMPLPGMGAVGLCTEVRVRGQTPVLVTTREGDPAWLDALRAGADDHVRIPCDERELRARLRALIRRFRGPMSPSRLVTVGELAVRVGRGIVTVEPALLLTPVQATILGHLAGQPGVVISEAGLIDRVRALHGPVSETKFDAEMRGLWTAVTVASGIPDALEQIEGCGWRLAAHVG